MGVSKQQPGVALVTGASSGIGRSCALHLHGLGWQVFGASRNIADQPDGLFKIQMDVDCDTSVRDGVAAVLAQAGRLDLVLNCAGFTTAGAVEETTIEEAKAQFETNLFGAWRVCREVLPVMRQQQSGTIVNISSIGGLIGIPFHGAYSASKFALEGLTEVLRIEARPFGIHVVLIEPGDTRTQATARRLKTVQAQQSPVYTQRFGKALRVIEHDEQHGAAPELVAQLLARIINDPHPRLHYTVGPPFQRLVVVLKKIVPAWFFEWGLMTYYGIH